MALFYLKRNQEVTCDLLKNQLARKTVAIPKALIFLSYIKINTNSSSGSKCLYFYMLLTLSL